MISHLTHTILAKTSTESQLIKARAALALYKHFAVITEGDEKVIEDVIEEELKANPRDLLDVYLEHTARYPELFEYPYAITLLMELNFEKE